MTDHSNDPVFQDRAMVADAKVREVMAELILAWSRDDVESESGIPIELSVRAALSGATAGLAELAWDSTTAFAAKERITMAFTRMITSSLGAIEADRPAGKLLKELGSIV